MAKSYTVGEGMEFNYPADFVTQQIVATAGGRSKLSEIDRANCTFKIVTEGMDCSDMPKHSLDLYVSRGQIIEKETIPEEVWKDLGRPKDGE